MRSEKGQASRSGSLSPLKPLNLKRVRQLERALRDKSVLTVYVAAPSADPAARATWRIDIRRSLADLRKWLADSPHTEREQFLACAATLEKLLISVRPGLGAEGLAAFITSEGVHAAGLLPVPMPTVAVWSTGACIAPLMRALKESRPVILAVADARRTHVYRYREGKLEHLHDVRAHHHLGPPLHLGRPPRGGFHHGTRGQTGRDAMQRGRAEGTRRMLDAAGAHVLRLAADDAWIIVAGDKRVRAALSADLEPSAPGRVAVMDSLSADAEDASLVRLAKRGASQLRDRANLHRLQQIATDGGTLQRSTVGYVDTGRALQEGRVRDLLFTHKFLGDHLADAEAAIRMALSQGALVEEVSGEAGRQLDGWGGIVARLRYPSKVEAGAAT